MHNATAWPAAIPAGEPDRPPVATTRAIFLAVLMLALGLSTSTWIYVLESRAISRVVFEAGAGGGFRGAQASSDSLRQFNHLVFWMAAASGLGGVGFLLALAAAASAWRRERLRRRRAYDVEWRKSASALQVQLLESRKREQDLEKSQSALQEKLDSLSSTKMQADAEVQQFRRAEKNFALEQQRATAKIAFEQARLAAFGADVGLALTRGDSLDAMLDRCARAMVKYLNVAVTQISTFDERTQTFEARATAQTPGGTALGPAGSGLLRLAASQLAGGRPVLIRHLLQDTRVADPQWLHGHGLVSGAAYPLMLEEKLVGCVSMFASHDIPEQLCQEIGSVGHGIALCIERKRSEAALDVSEIKYRSVVENIKEVIFQIDEFGNWTFLNPAWTAVTGFAVEPTLGTFFLEYIKEEDRDQTRSIFLQLLERRLEFCRYESRFLTKNGQVCWVEFYAQLTLNGDGTVLGASGSLIDITERKQAETAIQKLAAFPRVNPNPVLEFAAPGNLDYSNDAARAMARSLGKDDVLEILPPNASDLARECLVTGRNRMREEVRLNGRTLTWSFFPIAASQVVHCYGVDVTDMLNLEAQFRHAQKLESIGQLAAGVAHDFNNILTVIQGYADCLLARCSAADASQGPLTQISKASQRAAALTRQLLMFSRKQRIQPKVLDLNAVLQNMAKMLQRLLGEDIALEASYASDLPHLEADAGMLEQVTMNLAVNARDAMPKGGRLQISTSRVEIDAGYLSRHADARPGAFLCLAVTDSGCGMDGKTLEKIFEPFFSTKEVGKGTGLGLATVYGIVKQHQGWVEVTSALGQGSTFKVFFPAVARPANLAEESKSDTETVRGGNETILLVEDEPVLRELVREVLSQYQYRIIEAGSGVEALRVWDEHNGQVDLLLTDMVMPEGMSGCDLAQQLRQQKPHLKIIYTSGYSAESLTSDFAGPDTAFLPKPYLPPQLARLVRQSLDGASPPRRSELASA